MTSFFVIVDVVVVVERAAPVRARGADAVNLIGRCVKTVATQGGRGK